MASSLDSREKLLTDIDDKVLLCAICMERFKSPKILPCHHTFCEYCLTKWVKTNNGQLICPTCKNVWPLPSGGVPAITSNRFLNDLMEVISSNAHPESIAETVCEGCKKLAKYWCGDCSGHFFCNVCIQTHKVLTILQDHEPMTIAEYNEKKSTQHFRMTQPRFCANHRTTKLEFYCDTCQVPICLRCTVVDHPSPDHKMLSLESALEKYMPDMKAYSLKIAQKVSDLKLRKDRACGVRQDLDVNRSTAEQQINTLCEKLIDEIKKQQMKMLGQVDDIYIPKCKQSDANIELLEHKIASAESMLSYLNHLLTFGGAVDIMTAQKQMKDQQQHYDDLTNVLCGDNDSDLVFTENPDCLQIDLGVVRGNHLTTQGKPITSEVERKDGDKMDTITRNQLQVHREERSVTKQTGNTGLELIGRRELGVVEKKQTQTEALVVRAKHRQPTKEVQPTKRETKPAKTKQSNLPCVFADSPGGWSKFKLEGQGPSPGQKFKSPCGLTFHNDKLLVCDKGNNVVQILNKDYTCEKVLGSFSGQLAKAFQPQSVAVSQDNHYYILDDKNLQIIVCDQNNKVIRIITLPGDTDPRCIALLRGFVLVTDVKGHRLLKYTTNGQYVGEIGSKGHGRTRFNLPYFVAVNSRDVIMVSDCRNHCIKCFDADFNYLYQYGELGDGDSQLSFPYSIAVDGADNVYVCDFNNDRISIWSRDRTCIGHLFQRQVGNPWYIAVSRDRICVTGLTDKHITVFSK
ncbi:tripartite motif-containing protein 2-like isoform X2 [Ptychodera flava]|uniref:tripartite motif-containing protein 2-like isoform X2 n=1 Tax=Ptychodera flava TaxID=63121 RepID=UPI00396A3FFA